MSHSHTNSLDALENGEASGKKRLAPNSPTHTQPSKRVRKNNSVDPRIESPQVGTEHARNQALVDRFLQNHADKKPIRKMRNRLKAFAHRIRRATYTVDAFQSLAEDRCIFARQWLQNVNAESHIKDFIHTHYLGWKPALVEEHPVLGQHNQLDTDRTLDEETLKQKLHDLPLPMKIKSDVDKGETPLTGVHQQGLRVQAPKLSWKAASRKSARGINKRVNIQKLDGNVQDLTVVVQKLAGDIRDLSESIQKLASNIQKPPPDARYPTRIDDGNPLNTSTTQTLVYYDRPVGNPTNLPHSHPSLPRDDKDNRRLETSLDRWAFRFNDTNSNSSSLSDPPSDESTPEPFSKTPFDATSKLPPKTNVTLTLKPDSKANDSSPRNAELLAEKHNESQTNEGSATRSRRTGCVFTGNYYDPANYTG
ncbi:hypothetical protein DM02DRAFT_673419 [Periconia macrospinosa]|uniref:Uncharacterized protein n=1 Tax=Periconia macrospinosa TaxID=97972 RepID=A0A2V1DKP7_9PLEO|nr:hypothetical protein DM02DRAFT_673419 [Periconia macrospinosa]